MNGVRLPGLVLLAGALALAGCTTTSSDRVSQPQLKKASEINAKLGGEYMQQGQLKTAKEKLDKALKENSDNADAHSTYALLMMRLDRPDEAREHFERALDLDSSNPSLHNNYGTFLCQQGDYDAGIKQFLSAAKNKLYETPAYAYSNAGQCARDAGRPDEARKYLRQALAHDHRMASALYAMARLEMDQGHPEAAARYIKRFHKVATPVAQSLWLGVRIERALGDQSAARDYGRKLVRNFPDSDEAEQFLESR